MVEVLLASVRPAQLLTGKVIGMGATAFGQVAALVATFLIVAAATGSTCSTEPPSASSSSAPCGWCSATPFTAPRSPPPAR